MKSAEQNIEKEIPKIGPAIGETVKKIMGKDSSIWEVHDQKKRHYAYTTLAAARGLCDIAGIAKKGNKPDVAKYSDLAKQVRDGFTASFIDPQHALAGSLEGLAPGGKYTDGAVAEAFTFNVLQDWKGDTGRGSFTARRQGETAGGR